MPIKVFKFNEHDLEKIELKLNDWEKANKLKIDNISCCPVNWYTNSIGKDVVDSDVMIIVNYHKRKLRKKD